MLFITTSIMGNSVSPGIDYVNINSKTDPKETIHYVIIGAFSYSGNAKKYLRIASDFEYYVNLGFHLDNELYYVYLFNSIQIEDARKERDKIRMKYMKDLVKDGFDSAWVLTSQPLLTVDKRVSRTELAELAETVHIKPAIETIKIWEPEIDVEQKEAPPIEVEQAKEEQKLESKAKQPVKQVSEKGVALYPLIVNTVSMVTGNLVNGTIDIIDAQRAKKFRNWKANEVDLLPDPQNGAGLIQVVCDIFGYRKVQHTFSLNNLEEEDGNGFLEFKGDTININFELHRYEVGEIVTMYHVYFWPDATLMKPESKYELNQLLEMLQENEDLTVRVHGHTNGNSGGKIISRAKGSHNLFSIGENTTDGRGSARKLSMLRGEIIIEYLLQNGIDPDRLDVIGWGGKKPVFEMDDPRAKMNMKCEIEIITN